MLTVNPPEGVGWPALTTIPSENPISQRASRRADRRVQPNQEAPAGHAVPSGFPGIPSSSRFVLPAGLSEPAVTDIEGPATGHRTVRFGRRR